MPNQNEIALAKYKIEKAKNCLNASKLLLDYGLYADSANRSYYAIFHSMNALFALRNTLVFFKTSIWIILNPD